jgi:hypothetical protein
MIILIKKLIYLLTILLLLILLINKIWNIHYTENYIQLI